MSDEVEEIFPKEKLVFIVNNSMTYKDSLLNSFKKLKNLGVTDIIFMQDDMYGLNNILNSNYHETLESIFLGYKNLKLKWLHIFRSEIVNPEKISLKETQVNNIKFYKYCTKDFKNNTIMFSWCDGTYIADLEFLLNLYKNLGFYVKNSPWLTEYTIKMLMDKFKFTRYGINEHLFDTALIHGKHKVEYKFLKEHLMNFFPSESSNPEFQSLINDEKK